MDFDEPTIEQVDQAKELKMPGGPTIPATEDGIGLNDEELEEVSGGFIRIIPGD